MVSALNLNRCTSLVSAAALTVVGTFGSIISPVEAQQQPRCTPQASLTGTPISQAPTALRTAAQTVATRRSVTLTIFSVGSDRVYEFAGRQSNGCLLEIDVFGSGQNSGRIQEIETQRPTLTQVPQAVRTLLNRREPGLRVAFIEQSERPQVSGSVATFYEIEGTRRNGTNIEATINQAGTTIEVQVLQQLGD